MSKLDEEGLLELIIFCELLTSTYCRYMKIGRSIFAQKTEYDQQYHNATYIKLHV